ncbi:hypothetical protein ACFLWW_02555 [Chloroflexota bacterium]
MSELDKHPGYLGFTSQGVLLIHADWPIYPEEHGSDLALVWLTAFPPRTIFKMIDDIDRCNLFLACIENTKEDKPFDPKNFHVAIWHNDLLFLQDQGYIDGVSAITERKWEELKRITLSFVNEELKDKLPSLDDFNNEIYSWPEFHLGHIEVTPRGRKYAHKVLANSNESLITLGERIGHLMSSKYYDTAIREACLALESKVKKWLSSNLWGERLVDELSHQLNTDRRIIKSYAKIFCSQIRMALKFIRNDFMHNFIDIDEIQSKAILNRLARINYQLDQVIANLK